MNKDTIKYYVIEINYSANISAQVDGIFFGGHEICEYIDGTIFVRVDKGANDEAKDEMIKDAIAAHLVQKSTELNESDSQYDFEIESMYYKIITQ